jgi:hypothetical protein
MKKILLLFLYCIVITPIFAQFSAGVSSSNGIAVLSDAQSFNDAFVNNVSYDLYYPKRKSINFATENGFFAQYKHKKLIYKLGASFFQTKNRETSSRRPPILEAIGIFNQFANRTDVYYKTVEKFNYAKIGLHINYELSSRWSAGIGGGYLFRVGGFKSQEFEALSTENEALSNKIVFKNEVFEKTRVPIAMLNTTFGITKHLSASLNYQINLSSMHKVFVYHYHIIGLGINYCFL